MVVPEHPPASRRADRGHVPELMRWRTFWVIWGAVAILVLVPFNGWMAFVSMASSPFSKTYTLGIDEGDEEHRLFGLVGGRYGVWVTQEHPAWRPESLPESSISGRELVGGDLGVELVSDSGETLIPLEFIHGGPPTNRGVGGWSRRDSLLREHSYLFDPGLLDRYTLRVKVITTGTAPRPQKVHLRVVGSAGEYLWVPWSLWNSIVLLLFGSCLLVKLARHGRVHSRAVGRGERGVPTFDPASG